MIIAAALLAAAPLDAPLLDPETEQDVERYANAAADDRQPSDQTDAPTPAAEPERSPYAIRRDEWMPDAPGTEAPATTAPLYRHDLPVFPSPTAPPGLQGPGGLPPFVPREDEPRTRRPAAASMYDEDDQLGLGQALALGAICLVPIAGLLWLTSLEGERRRKLRSSLMNLIRRRAAAVICIGLGIVLIDWTMLDDLSSYDFLYDPHRMGWITLFGGAVALVGLYHWLAGPERDKTD